MRGGPRHAGRACRCARDIGELKGEFVVLVGPPAPGEADVGDDAIVARPQAGVAARELSRRRAQRGGRLQGQAEPRLRPWARRLSARIVARRERETHKSLSPRAVRRDGCGASASPQRPSHRRAALQGPVGEIDLVALKGKTPCLCRGEAAQEPRRCWLVAADAGAAAYRQGSAILACRPSRFCRSRPRLRRGAGGALGLAALHRECISGVGSHIASKRPPPHPARR